MAARRHGIAGWGLRLAAVIVLASSAPAKEKDRPPQKITSQLLDILAREYRAAGLPLPLPDAPLMLVQSKVESVIGRPNVTVYVVGFRVPASEEMDARDGFLMGIQQGEPGRDDSRVPPMRPLDTAKGLPSAIVLEEHWSNSSEVFPINNWLALAVQCHLRGYDRVAEQIFARGLAADRPVEERLTPVGDGGPLDSLAATMWNYWMNTLCTEDTDRREILAHLEKLSARFPALDGSFQRDYLASLRLAIIPGKAVPDSVESLVDTLVDHTGFGGSSRTDTNNPGFVNLQDLGFAAIPALIAHLDDRRMTRSAVAVDGGVGFYPRRVNEVVSDLIEDIAGPGEFPHEATGRPPGQPDDRTAVERWWAKATAMGEEMYMTSHVFPPSDVSLEIVAERYPHRLGEIYTRLLKERPDLDGQMILAVITSCAQLPREEKRRLLHEGLASSDLKCNFEAIGALLDFDRPEAEAALIEKLAHWPTDLDKPYSEQRRETLVANFVISMDSAEVWQAYERTLFRASTAFRMEMLKWLADGGARSMPQDVRRLAVLDLFLDDEEVRVIRKEDEAKGGRFEDYPLTADTRRISVRNFVAGLLSTLLNVKPPSGQAHDERWWAKYRTAVRAAIDQRARVVAEAPAREAE